MCWFDIFLFRLIVDVKFVHTGVIVMCNLIFWIMSTILIS